MQIDQLVKIHIHLVYSQNHHVSVGRRGRFVPGTHS